MPTDLAPKKQEHGIAFMIQVLRIGRVVYKKRNARGIEEGRKFNKLENHKFKPQFRQSLAVGTL